MNPVRQQGPRHPAVCWRWTAAEPAPLLPCGASLLPARPGCVAAGAQIFEGPGWACDKGGRPWATDLQCAGGGAWARVPFLPLRPLHCVADSSYRSLSLHHLCSSCMLAVRDICLVSWFWSFAVPLLVHASDPKISDTCLTVLARTGGGGLTWGWIEWNPWVSCTLGPVPVMPGCLLPCCIC